MKNIRLRKSHIVFGNQVNVMTAIDPQVKRELFVSYVITVRDGYNCNI